MSLRQTLFLAQLNKNSFHKNRNAVSAERNQTQNNMIAKKSRSFVDAKEFVHWYLKKNGVAKNWCGYGKAKKLDTTWIEQLQNFGICGSKYNHLVVSRSTKKNKIICKEVLFLLYSVFVGYMKENPIKGTSRI